MFCEASPTRKCDEADVTSGQIKTKRVHLNRSTFTWEKSNANDANHGCPYKRIEAILPMASRMLIIGRLILGGQRDCRLESGDFCVIFGPDIYIYIYTSGSELACVTIADVSYPRASKLASKQSSPWTWPAITLVGL